MQFASDVRAGLGARPKTLPPRWLYDELGSALFEAITLLPEYYLTRAETEVLAARAGEIIAAAAPARLVELGSGSALKTRYLIEAALRRRNPLDYSAIDISHTVLAATAKALAAQYPGLIVRSYQGEYYDGLQAMARDGVTGQKRPEPTLALFLGSNIGNFDPPEAQRLVSAIRAVLAAGDALLLGTDLKKDRRVLEAAYDDAIGLTAAFDRNLLGRINRELGGHFDLRTFRHLARYDEALGRVEMHLESTVAQLVGIDALSFEVDFAAGETIHTESSYKFAREDVQQLAEATGFALEHAWTDPQGRFACNLLRCV